MAIDGTELAPSLRGRQVPMLLAYLVLHRDRPVGRDELIDALWPRQPPQSQDGALRTLLSRLRSTLGGEVVNGREEVALSLPEPAWIDVEAARAGTQNAEEALEAGDVRSAWALAQVPLNIATRGLLPGAQAGWLEPLRRELSDLRMQALLVIGQAGLNLGGTQLASAARAARALIDAEPYRESGYILLMDALAGEGNIAEALRVFDRLRTLLRDELGTAPSADAIALHERLLSPGATGGVPVRTSRGGVRTPMQIVLPPELAGRAATPLVGRGAELQELQRRWDALTDENPARRELVLLLGDAGIGKTRLVAELATRAHAEGGIVLSGRSPEEPLAPYQPFLEALRHYVVNAPFAELRSTVREYGSEISRLVPDLRRRAPDLPPPSGEPATERYRLFEAVVGLLSEISRSAPVLLVLDDLHWADRPTLLLLRHLSRAPRTQRVLVVGAYRSTEADDAPFADALSELRHEGLVAELPLSGLTQADTAELVALQAGSAPEPGFVQALYEETEGNPLFVREIVQQLLSAGINPAEASASTLDRLALPDGVKRVIARRVKGLGADATEVLRAAATIGRDFDAALLEHVVDLDEDHFLDALDEALAGGVLQQVTGAPDRYGFSHALIRETLYEEMSEPRRLRTHRRVAEALEQLGGEQDLALLAVHFARGAGAQDLERALEYAYRAGDRATELLAYEEAVAHYKRGLEILDRFGSDQPEHRCRLLLLLGEAEVRAGRRAQAQPAFAQAAELAEELGDGEALAGAALGLSRRYVMQPGIVDEELIGLLERALVRNPQRTATRVQLLARLSAELYYSAERKRMGELSEEADAIAGELGDPMARAAAAAARRRALWHPSHLAERVAASTDMLTMARQLRSPELAQWAHAWLAVDLLEQGDRDAVDAQIEAFADGAERLRQPLYTWNVVVWRAMQALLSGQLDSAERLAGEALALGSGAEGVTAGQYYAIQLLVIRREQLRMHELTHAAWQMVESYPARPAWRAALATLLLESEQRAEAAEQLEILAAGDFADIPADGDWMIAVTLLADLCSGLGDERRCEQLYELLAPYAQINVVIGLAVACLGSAAGYLGKLALAMGRRDEAVGHFERAVETNAGLNAPVCLAHSQLDHALALPPGSERRGALIEAAAATAAKLHLPKVAARAAAL